jgi:hypothetical protein
LSADRPRSFRAKPKGFELLAVESWWRFRHELSTL